MPPCTEEAKMRGGKVRENDEESWERKICERADDRKSCE